MERISTIGVCLCLLFTVIIAKEIPTQHSLATLPINTAVLQGQNVTLQCSAVNGSGYRVQWWEYAYNSGGNLISDGNAIGSHPQAARYAILQPDSDTFNLFIMNVQATDGGLYRCKDANGVDSGSAQLIVLHGNPNCSTTLQTSGVVIEGQYYSAECVTTFYGGITPIQTWSGPDPHNTGYSTGSNTTWAGVNWYANRTMDTKAFQCFVNFTNNFVLDSDQSSNVPSWNFLYQTNQMFVYWGPTNMYATPNKTFYEIGETITCYADAFPSPTYKWQNTRTNQVYPSQGFQVDASLEGTTQTMRCQAENVIQGFTYSGDVFLNVTVLMRTTTASPTAPLPTTTPPAIAACADVTGRWESTNAITASLCLKVDNTADGQFIGQMRNNTDTYWIELVGRVREQGYDLLGMTGIWPGTAGVSSFVGECHACAGTEMLLVHHVQRSKGTGACGVSGPLTYSPVYTFYRTGPTCV